jgi:hypothetical protein
MCPGDVLLLYPDVYPRCLSLSAVCSPCHYFPLYHGKRNLWFGAPPCYLCVDLGITSNPDNAKLLSTLEDHTWARL